MAELLAAAQTYHIWLLSSWLRGSIHRKWLSAHSSDRGTSCTRHHTAAHWTQINLTCHTHRQTIAIFSPLAENVSTSQHEIHNMNDLTNNTRRWHNGPSFWSEWLQMILVLEVIRPTCNSWKPGQWSHSCQPHFTKENLIDTIWRH